MEHPMRFELIAAYYVNIVSFVALRKKTPRRMLNTRKRGTEQ
jgi:hypothetical protein